MSLYIQNYTGTLGDSINAINSYGLGDYVVQIIPVPQHGGYTIIYKFDVIMKEQVERLHKIQLF